MSETEQSHSLFGRRWRRGSLAIALGTLVAFAASQSACDKINELTGKSSDKADKDDDKKKKKKDDDEDEETEEEPSASAAPSSSAPVADAGAEDAATDAEEEEEEGEEEEEEEEEEEATNASEIKRYDDEVPQGGTVRLKVPFKARQAADLSSKEVASLAPGTLINLKASHSNWMLIEYPSGVGELSMGWIELKSRNDSKSVEEAKPPPDSPLVKKDAGKDGGKRDAGKRDGGRRDGGRRRDGGIKLQFPKK